ncbi:hypothetical protein ACWDPV_18770 [Gordonia sp. NPDC003504]
MSVIDDSHPGAAVLLQRVLTDQATSGDGVDDVRTRIVDAARDQFLINIRDAPTAAEG